MNDLIRKRTDDLNAKKHVCPAVGICQKVLCPRLEKIRGNSRESNLFKLIELSLYPTRINYNMQIWWEKPNLDEIETRHKREPLDGIRKWLFLRWFAWAAQDEQRLKSGLRGRLPSQFAHQTINNSLWQRV